MSQPFGFTAIIMHGPELKRAERYVGGLSLVMHPDTQPRITFSGKLPRGYDVRYPQRDDPELRIIPCRLFRNLAFELTGSQVAQALNQIRRATTYEEVGVTLKPLIDYFKEHVLLKPRK